MMPVRGRKPTPTVIKMLNGNPGRRALPLYEPRPQEVPLDFKPNLEGDALDVWREIAPALIDSGVLLSTDVFMAGMLCQQVALYRRAHDAVARARSFASPRTGQVSPALTAMNKSLAAIRALAADFGLTPSARARIVAAPPASATDEDRFFDAG
jgi:P27 family predicted phage terminase small subunit